MKPNFEEIAENIVVPSWTTHFYVDNQGFWASGAGRNELLATSDKYESPTYVFEQLSKILVKRLMDDRK